MPAEARNVAEPTRFIESDSHLKCNSYLHSPIRLRSRRRPSRRRRGARNEATDRSSESNDGKKLMGRSTRRTMDATYGECAQKISASKPTTTSRPIRKITPIVPPMNLSISTPHFLSRRVSWLFRPPSAFFPRPEQPCRCARSVWFKERTRPAERCSAQVQPMEHLARTAVGQIIGELGPGQANVAQYQRKQRKHRRDVERGMALEEPPRFARGSMCGCPVSCKCS